MPAPGEIALLEIVHLQIAEVKTSLAFSFEALDERLNAPEGREEVPQGREGENVLQFFGGLVLICIKTKFCKKICV